MSWRMLVAMIVLLVACTTPSARHDRGGQPRLVSLSPALTETLGELGALDQLVARSTFCTLPAEARSLPAVGSALTPDLEAIATLGPTRVLIDGSEGVPRESIGQIAPVSVLPWLTTAEVTGSVRTLGTITGREEAAEKLASRMEVGLAPHPVEGAPRTLLVLGTEGPAQGVWFIKPDSLHGTALVAAGGRNAVVGPVTGAPSLSVERVIALDPDRIVMLEPRTLTADEQQAAVARWAVLTPLTAASSGQVRVVAEPDLLSTGPRILHFVETIRPAVTP
mgnify:FL=1